MSRSVGRAARLVAGGVLIGSFLLTPPVDADGDAATPPAGSDALVGLWKAKRWFGPFARGALVIERSGKSYTADMSGALVPVRVEQDALAFELPDGQGIFRGRLPAQGGIAGHWFPPKTLSQISVYASPVALEPDGPDRWRGEVVPFEDVFTFYLLARKRADGSIGVVLRNPERDYGAQQGADRLARDGDVVTLYGRRAGQTEEREIARGRYDAERDVMTLDFPVRGGSYDFRRDGDESDFYPRGRNPGRYTYHAPLARDDGWPTGTLEDANIDRPAIERFIQMIVDTPMESADSPAIHGFLVARHGKLVLEEYFHGENRDRLHETRSAAKSVTATVVGAAMQAGAPLELSSPVYRVMYGGEFPPGLEPQKQAMTLEHLLTMSSGYYCDDTDPDAPGGEEIMINQEDEPDYYRFTLRVPMAWEPGLKAIYCSSNPNLALGMLSRATGESPIVTFDRVLGVPMGITRYGWPLDPAGHPYGGGGVQFLPRDFMKFGQLMLNGGTWRGKRLLGRDYVTRASSPQYYLRGAYYGYLWWGIDYPYKDRSVYAYFAGGAGGQAAIVVPELDLVVATFAGNYSSKGTTNTSQNLIARYILPAVREAGDDPDAPVIAREDFVTPYGRSATEGRVPGRR
jgi:CubicO group peptidase (beta-lactamase class C family)